MGKAILSAVAMAVALAFSPLAFGSNQDLLKSVPASSSVCVAVDIAALLQLPMVAEARASDPELEKQFQELEGKLAKRNLTISGMISNFVLFSDLKGQGMGVLLNTKMGESNLEDLLRGEIFGNSSSTYRVETIAGRRVYILKAGEGQLLDTLPGSDSKQLIDALLKQSADSEGKLMALTFLDKETLLIVPLQDYEKYVAAPKGLAKAALERSANIDAAAPLWGTVGIELPKAKPSPGVQGGNPIADKVRGIAFSFGPKPLSKGDLLVRASLECQDAASAAMVVSQLQQILFAMSFAAAKDPNSPLAEISSGLLLSNKDKYVSAELPLSKRMIEKLKQIQQQQQQAFGASPAPAAPTP